MERLVKLFSILLVAACAATACDLQLEPGTAEGLSVNLQLICTDPQVKATEPGEEAYKENTINYVDYFVYATTDGTTCLKHARVSPTNGHITVALNDLVGEGKPLTEGGNCYFYVVANWPDTFTGEESLSTLRTKTVTVAETELDVASAANHYFVMDTKDLVSATVTRTGSQATAELYRLEAKLTIEVNIPDHIESGSQTYTPDPTSLQIYYLYATRKGTLNGNPMSYSAATDGYYFNYPYNRAVTVTGNATDGYVGKAAPFYTYPEQWESHEISAPYFKVVLSWRSSGGAQTNKPYYYKVLLPESMGGRIDRNTIYKFIMNIGVLGSETDDGTVVIPGNYFVVDWLNGAHLGESTSITRGEYLEIPRETYYIYGNNAIEIPVTSSHNISVTVNSATYTNFSGQNPAPATLPSSAYSVTTDGRFAFTLTHNLVTDVTSPNLDCSPYTFDLTVSNGVSPSKQVRIIQYPPVYISAEQSNGYVFINGTNNRFTNPNVKAVLDDGGVIGRVFPPNINQNDVSGGIVTARNVTYTDSQGGATIRFEHIESVREGGVYLKAMGENWWWSDYNGTITLSAPNNGSITKITIGYYNGRNAQNVTYSVSGGSTTSSSKEVWEGSANQVTVTMAYSNDNTRNLVSSITVEYSYTATGQHIGTICSYSYAMSGAASNNPNIYSVYASSLAGTNWFIADPRSNEVDYPTLRGGSSTGTPLTGYMAVGSEYADAVAPVFKIASSYGAKYGIGNEDYSLDYEQADKRCASYQESGYPAGRWRIPTDAEIRFMAYLSANSKLPTLFSGWYWAASGRILHVQGSSVDYAAETVSTGSVRCVYDAWYWGNEQIGSYLTTWSGWQTNI